MKTVTRRVNGQVLELITNNNWEVSMEENAPEALELIKALGEKQEIKWNSHGCAIVKDDEGMSIVCKPALFGATHSSNASESSGPRISSRTPEVPEAYVDEILAMKGTSAEMKTWAQEIKDRWEELHRKEEEAKQKKFETIKKLTDGLTKEDIMALLGL
jgi:hypothetical protein